jgi:hypothetical protein
MQFEAQKPVAIRDLTILPITFSYQKLEVGAFYADAHNRRHYGILTKCLISLRGTGV